MVLGTVSATNAASQQLRLDYITTKPLSSFSAFKDALPEQQRDLLVLCTAAYYFWGGSVVAQVSCLFSSLQLAMRGLLSWFVVQLMPAFSLIDSELTCWGLLDVHSPEGGPSNPPQ